MKIAVFLIAIASFAVSASAQVRPAESGSIQVAQENRSKLEKFKVKYMGGLFGFSEKQKGRVELDSTSERLVFYAKKDGKEKFSVPFSAIRVVYPSTRKVQSGVGRGVGAVPIPGAGIGGSFIKKKKNYLVINYVDQDAQVSGTMTFLVDTTELLLNAIYSLGESADMNRRGDAYVRGATY